MCGAKNAGRTTNRKSYARAGVGISERGVHGQDKRADRRRRRVRERRQWTADAA